MAEQIVLIKDGFTLDRRGFIFSKSCVKEEDFPLIVDIKDGEFVVDTCTLYYRDNAIVTDYPHSPEGFDMQIGGSTRNAFSAEADNVVACRLYIHYVYFRKRQQSRS
jgi:hypothetical protein